MESFGLKAGLFAALIAVGVFLGIEIATSGLERVQGPLPAASIPAAAPQAAPPQPQVQPKPPELVRPAAINSGQHTFINRLAIKTGEALRWSAQRIIRWTATAFDELLH